MKLGQARIGYAAYSRDFSVAGDRRRFAAYARMKGLPIEYADLSSDYDLVYATYSSDLSGWIARKRREGDRFKFVFELIDSYLSQTGLLRRLLKGTGRYALGTESRLSPDFLKTLMNACEVADAVVCSTEEQRQAMLRYNPNVVISFDDFGDELGRPKTDYARGDKLRIVWEGQSTTLPNLQVIRGPLNDLRDRVELHLVTDPRIARWFGRFGSYKSVDALRGFEIQPTFHLWSRNGFAEATKACDVAVIPIDRTDKLSWGKPENKLNMLWKMGMPVLTTATPAYSRAMSAAGISMTCDSEAAWGASLERLIAARDTELAQLGRQGRAFADLRYSRVEFVSRFDEALGLAGFEVA